MTRSALKGKAFEYFMRKLLIGCGFTSVKSDGTIIYDGSAGQMVHGLGQPHNADVLMSPPIQTPFYYTTNLIVECKWHNEPLGIPFARNVLGLREDLNHFDIVTKDILDARKTYRGSTPKLYPFDRCIYQVALASVSGFKRTTIEFANVHRIPLISFAEATLFKELRDFLDMADKIENNLTESDITSLKDVWMGKEDWKHYSRRFWLDKSLSAFFEYVDKITQSVNIAILKNGTLLFLHKLRGEEQLYYVDRNKENDGSFTLYWDEYKYVWTLCGQEKIYQFELPKEMLVEWKEASDQWEDEFKTREKALHMKKGYFSEIYLLSNRNGKSNIETLRLNKRFLDDAYQNLYKRDKSNKSSY